jgi:uncharacterized membrane protein YkvA (DUF1232 family)
MSEKDFDPKQLHLLRSKNPFTVAKILFHLPSWCKLAWRLFKDSRMPIYLKALPVFALCYFVFPLDFDRFAPLGYLDDLGVLIYCLTIYFKKAPKELVAEHLHKLEEEKTTFS